MINESNLQITVKITKVKPSKELIQEILTIFSMPTMPTSSVCTSDQILARNILSTRPTEQALTSAAILLNFQSSLFIPNEDASLAEILRKMIALGFFAPQIYNTQLFSADVKSLISFVSDYLKKSTINISQISAAIAFLLASISPYASKIFVNILDLKNVMDIYLTKKVINDLVIPLFFDFFLAVFMSLTLDKKIEQNEFEIFSDLMKILASTLMTQISFNFDNELLTDKLLDYISNHYLSITTRAELFNLLISLSVKSKSGIFEKPSNIDKITTFISDYIKTIEFNYELKKIEPLCELNTSLKMKETFYPPFKEDFIFESRKKASIVSGAMPPADLELVCKNQQFNTIIQLISNLCRSIKGPKLALNHSRFLTSFLRIGAIHIPIGPFFINSWVSNIGLNDPASITEYLHNCKFFQCSLDLAFLTYDNQDLRNYIIQLYLWISANSPRDNFFIIDLINVLQNSIISVQASQELCDLVLKIALMNTALFLDACKASNFHLLMSNDLEFYMTNSHDDTKSEAELNIIIENFRILMQFLTDLSMESDVFLYLFSKNDYLSSVISSFFCQSTAHFAFTQIARTIEYAKKINDRAPTLKIIFKFFATKLFIVQGMPSKVLNSIVNFCTLGFVEIPGVIGPIFKESHFLEILVKISTEGNLSDSVETLLDLFVKISISKCNYAPNIELFLKLSPLIKSRENMSLVDFLLKIAFDDDLKMTEVRKIVNPGPLSLLLQVFKGDNEKFTDFIKFVQKCFQLSMFETVQTDFTSQLILTLSDYRSRTEKDEIFDLVLNFLREIMTISVTSKDLLLFFQLFTSTKDNIRPFFTADLLRTLISVFKNHQNSAQSFFSLDGNGSIELPIVSAEQINNGFTLSFSIEILDRCGTLFRFKNLTESFSLSFTEDKFIKVDDVIFEQTFRTGKWLNIVIKCHKNVLTISANDEVIIEYDRKKPIKCDLNKNIIGQGMKANIEYVRLESNKSSIFDFGAASFCESYSIDREKVAKVNGSIFHLPSPPKEVINSIGGVSIILPLFCQIEQPSTKTSLTATSDSKTTIPTTTTNQSTNNNNNNETNNNDTNSNSNIDVNDSGNIDAIDDINSDNIGNVVNETDKDASPNTNEGNGAKSNVVVKANDDDENLLELVLSLLHVLLKDSPQQQRDFSTIGGFKLVSELLTLVSIDKFTPRVFCGIFDVALCITDVDLLLQMVESIFFDLGTWVYVVDIKRLFYEQCFLKLSQNFSKRPELLSPVVNVQYVLYLVRCHLFTSANVDTAICLSQSEKKTLDGRVIAERPKEIKELRSSFLKFVKDISLHHLTREDINTLLFFCFDKTDKIFQRNCVNLLAMMIRDDCPKLANYYQDLPYKELIGLVGQKEVRTQLEALYLINEFVAKNTIKINKKVIIAAVVKYFATNNVYDTKYSSYLLKAKMVNELLIPIFLLTLTTNPEGKQIALLYKMFTEKITIEDFLENEIFFILFLLQCFLDQTKMGNDFDELLKETVPFWSRKSEPFVFLHRMVETIESRSKCDFSGFLRRIYTFSVFQEFPKTYFDSVILTIYKFLFEIPSFDGYSKLFGFPQPNKHMTFSDLFNIINNNTNTNSNNSNNNINSNNSSNNNSNMNNANIGNNINNINNNTNNSSYHFSIRVDDNCKWVDFELALLFCEVIQINPQNLEYVSLIIGSGLIDKAFYKHIDKVVRGIKAIESDTPTRKNALIILLGSIGRNILKGNCDQLVEIFNNTINALQQEVTQYMKSKSQQTEESDDQLSSYISVFVSRLSKYEEDLETKINTLNVHEFYKAFADLTALENPQRMLVNVEQYRTSLSSFATIRRKEKRQTMKRYKQLFSQLSSDNGPWTTPESPPVLHYKLDNTLTRTRLVPNLKFNIHKDASLARDLGSYENAQAAIREQIAKMKMKTFASDFSLIDFNDVEEEKDKKSSSDRDIMICQSQLVTPRKLHSGELNLTKRAIFFDAKSKFVRIPLKKIKKILFRRYLMIDTAIEIFTSFSKVYFINFFNDQERLKFVTKISSLKIPSIKFIQKKWDDIKPLLKRTVKKWQDGQISNFDYIMKINILAGRSFNDLSQYPVFPWVLKDYTSQRLDFENPDIYRDLSKPLGTIGKDRLELMRERMNSGIGSDTQYLYGALYSSPAVVIGYLIRMEPFTSLHVQLQSNRFDVADRLFVSIPSAYDSVTTTQMDFRELIPEFFLIPDFLNNADGFDLGILTSKEVVNDVKLPAWAKTAREFIEINKRALESDYVTENLHKWIDLFFGPHSRPPLSFEIDNVFSPSFYETALEGADEQQVDYLKEYAACFGCACVQIFDEFPEPYSGARRISLGAFRNSSNIAEFLKPVLLVNTYKSDTLSISTDLQFVLNENVKGKLNCHIPLELERVKPTIAVNKRSCALALKWSSKVSLYQIRNGICEPTQEPISSSLNISMISISDHFLATAFTDCTLRVFKIGKNKQVGFLSKHVRPIVFTKICERFNTVFSISSDGFVSCLSLIDGRYLRGVDSGFTEPSQFLISRSGFIVIAFNGPDSCNIVIFDQNLEKVTSVLLEEAIETWSAAERCGDELLLIAYRGSCTISTFMLPYLEKAKEYNANQQVTAISFIKKPVPKIVVGSQKGTVAVVDLEL